MIISGDLGSTLRRVLSKFVHKGSDDYSQLGEQMVILNILSRMDQASLNKIYLDIGAYHPFKGSNTYKLYLKNWKGIVVDPNPEKIKRFIAVRPNDICLTKAVIPDGWNITEVEMLATGKNDARESITPALNKNNHLHFNKELADYSYMASAMKVSDVLTTCSEILGIPAFMSVDIEGLESDLIQSIDFSKYPIPLLCVEHFLSEFTQEKSVFSYQKSLMVQYLDSAGYELVSVCGISLILAHRNYYVPYG